MVMLEETHDCSLESSVTGRNAGEVVAVETVHRVHKVCIILTMLHFPRKTVPLESKCCVLKVYFFPDSLTPKLSEIDFKLKDTNVPVSYNSVFGRKVIH